MEFVSLETLREANHFSQLCEPNAQLIERWTFVGGIATVAKSKTSWYWVNSGNRIDYDLKFAPGQPDNANNNEMCLSIGFVSGNASLNLIFNDLPCSTVVTRFICQTKDVV